jgi:hypothetical protein
MRVGLIITIRKLGSQHDEAQQQILKKKTKNK